MTSASDDERLTILRARAAELADSGDLIGALDLIEAEVSDDLTHPLALDFARLAASSRAASRLSRVALHAVASWERLDAKRVLAIAGALAELGQFEQALAVSAHAAAASDADVARGRAQWAMQLERYDVAIAAADVAIEALLHDGIDVESFVRMSLRGAQIEGLMAVERRAVTRLRRLHEPFAVRWEALLRCGRVVEARAMRALCIRHFPDRASVWAAAGNQALDEGEPDQAEVCFDRCLRLHPRWTAALAGKAIVFEFRKDWPQALEYRERVVRVERALEREDAPSLQRVLRYAAALGRVARWSDAEVLFRRCVALRAFESLSAERRVLLRVFSRELYAPALLATLASQVPSALAGCGPEVMLGLREASVFGACYARVRARADLTSAVSLPLLGVCAWLAGDHARAYALFDEAEMHREGVLATQFYLAWCARALGAPELPSITQFALEAARSVLEAGRHPSLDCDPARPREDAHTPMPTQQRGVAPAPADSQVREAELLFYAHITLATLTPPEAETSEGPALNAACDAFRAWQPGSLVHEADACPRLSVPAQSMDLHGQLWRLAAFRAAHRSAGHSALEVAQSSVEAVALIEISAAITDPSS